MQHPTFSAALAEYRQADLRREASQARLARGSRPRRPPAGCGRPPGQPGPKRGSWQALLVSGFSRTAAATATALVLNDPSDSCCGTPRNAAG